MILIGPRRRTGRHDELAVGAAARIVARRGDHDGAAGKRLLHAQHLQQAVEKDEVRAIGLERCGRRQIADPALIDPIRDGRREIEADRHRDDLRALLMRPRHPTDQHVGIATVPLDDLADQRAAHARGDADPNTVDVAAEKNAGTVRSVPVGIPVAGAGEILLKKIDVPECGVLGIDAGIEKRHGHVGAGELRSVGAHRADAPRLTAAPGRDRDAGLDRAVGDR